jgi:hypothetical protein
MQIGVIEEIEPKDPNGGLQIRKIAKNPEFRRVLEDDAPDGFNFWFVHVVNKDLGADGFQAPRHNHTFQQIRFIQEGEMNVGPDEFLLAGDISYAGRGTYYGPQRREATSITMGIQFGFNGEFQRGPFWESRRAETLERLNARGKIENGLYLETDPVTGKVTTRDSMEALFDERHRLLKGKPLPIPPAGYDSLVTMHPQSFAYHQAAPGVEVKHLGKFYDQPGPNGDVSISMVRLSGGIYPLRADRPQCAWTVGTGLKAGDRVCPGTTAIYSPRGEQAEFGGDNGLEVFVVEFPRLD